MENLDDEEDEDGAEDEDFVFDDEEDEFEDEEGKFLPPFLFLFLTFGSLLSFKYSLIVHQLSKSNSDEDGDDADAALDDDEILDESDIRLATESSGAADDFPQGEEDEVENEEEKYEERDDDEDDEEEAGPSGEWDDDEYFADNALEDDPGDPNYQKQKDLIKTGIAESERLEKDRNFDVLDFLEHVPPDQITMLDQVMNEFPTSEEVEKRAEELRLTDGDFEKIDIEEEMSEVTDLMNDDPYPRHEEGEVNHLEVTNGISDDDMEELDNAWKHIQATQMETEWDQLMVRELKGLEGLSNKTVEEMEDCLELIDGAGYNCTRWLLYDLDFNIENLMLAAVKHNREAPIFFQHWYPQLVTYSRYKNSQAKDFDFTWEDVEKADISELERYYRGMGYDEIPEKPPAETGIIGFDYLDEEELKMAAFENWIKEVYNPEWDKLDFDDDDIQDEDNVFSNFYEHPEHPDIPSFEDTQEEIKEWQEGMDLTDEQISFNKEAKKYRNYVANNLEYDVLVDEEFEREFRGHLIVACSGDDSDLEIAEQITLAMEKAFGKKIYVETRMLAHAREEDNVFEVWLESYDIELIHSKKRATSNTQDWDGPDDCDDKQILYLVDRVGFLISDDARYSYSLEFDGVV